MKETNVSKLFDLVAQNSILFITLIILILLCFSAPLVHAQTPLDADTAVRLALENNLSLQRSRLDIAGAKRKADRSWNSLLPSLTASGSVGRATSLIDPVPAGQDEWVPGFSFSAALQLSPVIVTNIQQAGKEYDAGLISYETARQELEFQVRKLFYQILLLQSNVSLMAQNAATARERYEQTLVLRRVGQASRLDELSAQVDLQTQAASLRSAEIQYANALDTLKQLLMLPPEEAITPQGSFMPAWESTPGNSVTVLPQETGHSLWESGLSPGESGAIAAQRQALKVLEVQRKSARNQAYTPALNLSWNTAPVYSASPISGDKAWMDNGQFSIALSFNLDNLLPASKAREQIAALNDSITNQQSILQEAILNSQNSTEKLRRNIAQSLDNIETLRLNITLAEETYEMHDEAYRKGAADLQSLRSAQDSLSLAQNRLLEERYNLALAVLELEKEINVPFGSSGL
jgi:outer membrane protein TolC